MILYELVFTLIAINSSLSVATIKSTAVKHTTLSLSGVLAGWRRRLEERAAMCHMLRPYGPLGTCLRPPGTQPAKTAGLFWRSVEQDRVDLERQDWGMGLQMGRSRWGARTGRTGGGPWRGGVLCEMNY